jgi:hypothetical protein
LAGRVRAPPSHSRRRFAERCGQLLVTKWVAVPVYLRHPGEHLAQGTAVADVEFSPDVVCTPPLAGIKKQACINRKCLLMVPRDEDGEKLARKRAKQRAIVPGDRSLGTSAAFFGDPSNFLTGINIQLPLSPASPRSGTSSPASPDDGRSPPALDAAASSSVKSPSPEAATSESSMPPPAPESPRLTPRPTSPAAPGMTPPPSPPEGEAALKAAHEETVAKGEETEGESEADEAHWKDEVMAMTSPPPSPPSASVVPVAVKNDRRRAKRIAQRELAGMPPEEQRLAFHKSIELELTQEVFPGTFAEFLTKVVQFGYVSMFSAAFPIAAISSAVGNFIEIRLDAIKVLQSRRRRYEGAEDIGSWQDVLVLMSWIALPINVSLFVFTSWTFRKYVLVPSIATSDSTKSSTFFQAFFARCDAV